MFSPVTPGSDRIGSAMAWSVFSGLRRDTVFVCQAAFCPLDWSGTLRCTVLPAPICSHLKHGHVRRSNSAGDDSLGRAFFSMPEVAGGLRVLICSDVRAQDLEPETLTVHQGQLR